jgi:hypothetical protein
MKDDVNPMNPARAVALTAANRATRCNAHSKRTGQPCRAPAMLGWRVCRFHGAGGGHKAGPSHPSWKHGMRSQEWVEMRQLVNELARETREIEALIG